MRIIAGSAKGTRLAPVPGGTRPLADRAREGLFSSVGSAVVGARVLDLFAGTGAVGIEALSRGAAHATFVDASPAAIRTIRRNLRLTRLEGPATVVRGSASSTVRPGFGPFDLIFLDPPYALAGADLDALLAALAGAGVAEPGGLVALTRERGSYTPVIPLDWAADRRLSYGAAEIFVYRAYAAQPRSGRHESMGLAVLCPGTFDPVTNGHLDIITRAAGIFDPVVVAVSQHPAKTPLFDLQERLAMLRRAVADLPNVEVDSFGGLLVDFARDRGARVVVKGLRAVTDFDYELQMAQMNHHMTGVETFFVPTNPQWSYLSSSLVKEVVSLGGDGTGMVPDFVLERLREKLSGRSARAWTS